MFDYLEKTYNVEIQLVSCGQFTLYNAFLPNNKHAGRLKTDVKAVYDDVIGKDQPLPDGRTYLQL